MSEDAERRYQELHNPAHEGTAAVQTDQPESTTCSTFVNLNFETEDCLPSGESKQDVTPVSA